jgi:hypothetical protein
VVSQLLRLKQIVCAENDGVLFTAQSGDGVAYRRALCGSIALVGSSQENRRVAHRADQRQFWRIPFE